MRKRKKGNLIAITAIIAALFLIACIVIICVGRNQLTNYKTQVTDLQYALDSNTVTIYVANRDIKAGEKLIADSMVNDVDILEEDVNVHLQESINGLPEDFFMSKEQLGCQVTIDVKAEEPIMESMVAKTTISTDLREYEISTARLMTDQQEYDYVDVRILFPDGSDYLVLSKKPVNNLHLDNCVFFTYCNEDEILRYSSAIIDAFTTTGAYIYTTRYVESSLQEEAIPYYPVRSSTLPLIQSDPNIISVATETLNAEARANLASRLSLLQEEQLESVAEGFGLSDTARGTVFDQRISAEEESKATEETSEDFTSYNIQEEENPEEEVFSEEEVTDGGVGE